MPIQELTSDITIFGGGAAGLWLLARLRQCGYRVLLFETESLGGGQTHKAQGIIHGGLKYALQGKLTKAALAIRDMPERWKKCWHGSGELDLSGVPILASTQHLLALRKLPQKLAGFLATKALASTVRLLAPYEYPRLLHRLQFDGGVYGLDELVIDVAKLVEVLASFSSDCIYKSEALTPAAVEFNPTGELKRILVRAEGAIVSVRAKYYIFASGLGNENLIQGIPQLNCPMQRRGLHMTLIQLPPQYKSEDYRLFSHWIGFGMQPRLTITTYQTPAGEWIWYVGGAVAETGVDRDTEQQVSYVRQEIFNLFPNLNLQQAKYATFRIERAEPVQKFGLKPDLSFMQAEKNIIIVWPIKLTLIPQLSDEVIKLMNQYLPLAYSYDLTHQWKEVMDNWPKPKLAPAIWSQYFE